MPTQEAFSFLTGTPLLSSLDPAVVRVLSRQVLQEFHPKGCPILHQNGPAAGHLRIIKSGAVKIFVRTNEGEEVLVGYRTRGDSFGLFSSVYRDLSPESVVATEDTTCYCIQKETVLELLKTNARFSEYCFRSLLTRLIDMTYKDIRDRALMYGGGDKLLFTNVLADLAVKQVVTASDDISIQKAAEKMAERGISSLVLLDADGLPSGMITDRDLRNKVVARGRAMTDRVGDIMSIAIIKSESRDYCFEALLKMIRYNIHHLLVVNKGEMAGIITSHDLMMLQGNSPLSVAREIEAQSTIDGLVPVSKKIDGVVRVLIKEGAKASTITRIITEINERLLNKILEITEARFGPPPVTYCWIVYGSEGRKEQTFRTDQDNAIIYDDVQGREEDAARYFEEFTASIKKSLVQCGFPACKADYMASNPRWRQPLTIWKQYFSRWINEPTPEALLSALIFFDFRPVHGNMLLAEKLRAYAGHQTRDKKVFLAHLAGQASRNSPPLGFFGNFLCEGSGIHKGKFDIKINALSPIIDAVRLSAIEAMVYHTSTLSRLAELKDRSDNLVAPFCKELEQIFEFLMSLRLRHQLQQIEAGIEPDNFIDPDGLTLIEKKMLKESFKLIRSVQASVMKKYSSYMVL